jgi:hypothetical protein
MLREKTPILPYEADAQTPNKITRGKSIFFSFFGDCAFAIGINLFKKLRKLSHLPRLGGGGDDPVCLSALDETTLGRFGYNEMQVQLMKESTFR